MSGQVKTRLIPSLGVAGATALYQELLYHCLSQVIGIVPTQLWCTPDTHHPFLQRCQQQFHVSLHTQWGIDLGERMANALASTTSQPTVLIGSDCPSLNAQVIREAFIALQRGYPVVIAPAEDGGYSLIGMRQVIPELFTHLPWSTPQILTLTRERLRQLELPYWELQMQWDVDRPEDVVRWNQMDKPLKV